MPVFKVASFTIAMGSLLIAASPTLAQTKSERCAEYARQATAATPTTTGVVRGAARGAVTGAMPWGILKTSQGLPARGAGRYRFRNDARSAVGRFAHRDPLSGRDTRSGAAPGPQWCGGASV